MMKEALVLAAGRGARLDRPGTPKPLVDVDGQAMVIRLLDQVGDLARDDSGLSRARSGKYQQGASDVVDGFLLTGVELAHWAWWSGTVAKRFGGVCKAGWV